MAKVQLVNDWFGPDGVRYRRHQRWRGQDYTTIPNSLVKYLPKSAELLPSDYEPDFGARKKLTKDSIFGLDTQRAKREQIYADEPDEKPDEEPEEEPEEEPDEDHEQPVSEATALAEVNEKADAAFEAARDKAERLKATRLTNLKAGREKAKANRKKAGGQKGRK